jgi:hypothetical protein
MTDEIRCGVPYTRAYKQGRAGFYLPEMVMKGNEDSRRMLTVPFILKDFVKAFFGPTLDFWARLRNLPDKPVVENASEATSSELGLSLEEHLNVDSSKSVTGASQRSPTPTRLAASAVAGHVSAPENEEPPGSGIQDDSLSASSSLELSLVVSISLMSFIDRTPTPSRPSDKQDKSLLDPAITIVAPSTEMDLDQGSTNVLSPERQMPSLVGRAPRERVENLLALNIPQERPRSPIMSLLQSLPRHLI